MVRHYQRKTDRSNAPKEALRAAAEAVLDGGLSLRKSATLNGVNYRTLARFVSIFEKNRTAENITIGYAKPRQILNDDIERDMVEYAKKAAVIFHGITIDDLRQLAYRLAVANDIANMPDNWKKEKAGVDWAKHFLERHTDLSIRKPEATSIQRMANFNKHNVGMFMDNLERVQNRAGGFGPDQIWNVDETGVTTVQRPVKILAEKGVRQVGSVVSQERGTLVTVTCAVNALGNHIPPYFVFPRVHVQDNWLLVAPPGSAASGHPKASGWMTTDNFIQYMKHFVNYAKPSEAKPILLLLDNHHSHISLEAIEYAKANHITLLSFPPHCSHELQPLDKSVNGPFKTYINQASDSWMREKENAGKSMTIHIIPKLVSYAFIKAMTPENITAGFKATGIYPFDRNVFPEHKFLAGYVTDRPLPQDDPTTPEPQPSSSDAAQPVSAEAIRPFGRLAPRVKGAPVRKKGKSQIFTDTPVKAALEREAQAKRSKQGTTTRRKLNQPSESGQNKIQKKHPIVQLLDESSDGESDVEALCDDSSGSDVSEIEERQVILQPSFADLNIDDHILVKFATKCTISYYVGRVVSIDEQNDDVETTFMRRQKTAKCERVQLQFCFPETPDKSTHDLQDVVMKLPVPTAGQTKRSAKLYDFHCHALSKYHIN